MPRYYFHVYHGARSTDSDGVVLPDLEAARVGARRFAGEVIRDAADSADFGGTLRVEVADEADITVFIMEYRGNEEPPADT